MARKLGANMISYALGYRELSKPLTSRKKYLSRRKKTGKSQRGHFILAQIRHKGDWDPDPRGTENLIKNLAEKTNLKVYPKRRIVNLERTNIFQYPFLYLTGHKSFSFSATAIKKLRLYLKKGGFLFADACCGEKKFDWAFRTFIKKVLPASKLQKIPPSHPVFSVFHNIEKVNYTRLTKKTPLPLKSTSKDLKPVWKQHQKTFKARLYAEGLFLEDRLVVFYSKYDLGCGWEQMPCLMCKGLDPLSADSFKVATNVIIHSFSGE